MLTGWCCAGFVHPNTPAENSWVQWFCHVQKTWFHPSSPTSGSHSLCVLSFSKFSELWEEACNTDVPIQAHPRHLFFAYVMQKTHPMAVSTLLGQQYSGLYKIQKTSWTLACIHCSLFLACRCIADACSCLCNLPSMKDYSMNCDIE